MDGYVEMSESAFPLVPYLPLQGVYSLTIFLVSVVHRSCDFFQIWAIRTLSDMMRRLAGNKSYVLAVVAIVVLTHLHLQAFSEFWPFSWFDPSGTLARDFSERQPLETRRFCAGIAVSLALSIFFSCISRLRRYPAYATIIFIFISLAVGGAICRIPALRGNLRLNELSFWMGTSVSVVAASMRKVIHVKSPPTAFFLCMTFLSSFNILLLIAPFSELVPSPIQTPATLSVEFGKITKVDALAVAENPIFMALRSALSAELGFSIAGNNIVSIVLASFSFTLLGYCVLALTGDVVAACAAFLLILTDRWCLKAALVGNLIVTPLPLVAISSFSSLMALRSSTSRSPVVYIGLVLLLSFFSGYALYSYAAIRPFWILSILFVAVLIGFSPRRTHPFKMGFHAAVSILLPLLVVITLLAVNYKGNLHQALSHLNHQPKVISYADLPAGFQIRSEPDRPIWYGSAQTSSGKIFFFRRTFSETVTGIVDYISNILNLRPNEFPLSLDVMLLTVFGLLNGLLIFGGYRRFFLVAVTMILALSSLSYFLLEDAMAFRRAIGSSMLCEVFVFFAFVQHRRWTEAKPGMFSYGGLLLFAVYICARASEDLNLLVGPTGKIFASAHCQSAMPIRALILRQNLDFWQTNKVVFAFQERSHPHFKTCLDGALRTREIHRLIPNFTKAEVPQGGLPAALQELEPASVLLIDCTPDARRDQEINSACEGHPRNGSFVTWAPEKSRHYRGYWAILEKRPVESANQPPLFDRESASSHSQEP